MPALKLNAQQQKVVAMLAGLGVVLNLLIKSNFGFSF